MTCDLSLLPKIMKEIITGLVRLDDIYIYIHIIQCTGSMGTHDALMLMKWAH